MPILSPERKPESLIRFREGNRTSRACYGELLEERLNFHVVAKDGVPEFSMGGFSHLEQKLVREKWSWSNQSSGAWASAWSESRQSSR